MSGISGASGTNGAQGPAASGPESTSAKTARHRALARLQSFRATRALPLPRPRPPGRTRTAGEHRPPVPDADRAQPRAPRPYVPHRNLPTAYDARDDSNRVALWISRVRPFSVKTKLGTLVVVSVFITTGLLMIAVRTETELRFITVFSVIATLLITQFVAHSLTAPLDEMNTVARAISHGDYTRRVNGVGRRDELGDLAATFNRMAADLEAQDQQRKELVANVSHELRTPIAALRAVLENVVDGVSAADPETMRTALQQTERLGRLVETLLDLSRLDNGVVPLKARRFEVWPYLSGVLKEANMIASARAGIASGSGSHTRTDVHLHLDVSPPELTAHADAERMHQVVANLIDNAVKHSPPHGRVTVRARRGADPAVTGPGSAGRGAGHPALRVVPRLRALQPRQPPRAERRARTGQRRRHRPWPRHRPMGGRPARRQDQSGRIRARLPDPGHPSGTSLAAELTQVRSSAARATGARHSGPV